MKPSFGGVYAGYRFAQPSLRSLQASVLIAPGAKLWTLDKRLAKLAERFGVMYQTLLTAS